MHKGLAIKTELPSSRVWSITKQEPDYSEPRDLHTDRNMLTPVVLVLIWSRFGTTLILPHRSPVPGQTAATKGWSILCLRSNSEHSLPSADPAPRHAPCLVYETLAALREALRGDGDPTDPSLSRFGICLDSEDSARSLLSGLAEERRNRTEGLDVLHPAAGI